MMVDLGMVNFDAVSRQTLHALPYVTRLIQVRYMDSIGKVIALKTNSGHYAKLRIDFMGMYFCFTWVTYM